MLSMFDATIELEGRTVSRKLDSAARAKFLEP